jgi:hypothetical protein
MDVRCYVGLQRVSRLLLLKTSFVDRDPKATLWALLLCCAL